MEARAVDRGSLKVSIGHNLFSLLNSVIITFSLGNSGSMFTVGNQLMKYIGCSKNLGGANL